MNKLELAEYETIPFVTAIGHALRLALLTGLLLTIGFLCIPLSGWAADQPVMVTAPMLMGALRELLVGQSIDWLGYDIGEQVWSRLGGIGVGMGLAGIFGFLIQHAITQPIDTRQHHSGRRLFFGKAAVSGASAEILTKARQKNAPGLAPGVPWPRALQVLNLLILGAIGSGKTRILLGIIEGLLKQAEEPGRDFGLLIHDATGEILAGLPVSDTDVAVISSSGRSAYGWAMSRDITTVEDCESAGAQRALSTGESGMWQAGAATLDAGAMVLCQQQHENWSAPELYGMSLRDPAWLKEQWEIHYPPAAGLIEVDAASGELSKTTVSLLITWRTNTLRLLRPLAASWQNLSPQRLFSFAEWLHGSGKQPRIVVLSRNGRHPSIEAGWIGMAIDAVAGHAGDPALPVSQTRLRTFVLEEAPTLGRLQRWLEILDIGRNKGLSTIAVAQDLTQVSTTYGEVARSILQRFRLKIICEQTPGPDAKEVSEDWIGKRKVRDWSNAKIVDGKKQRPDPEEALIVPAEHLSDRLGVDGGVVHALLVGLKQVYRLEWPITVWPKRR